MLQLAPFPSDNYRYKVVLLVVLTILGTFLWDRLCVMIFAPNVFKAMRQEASKVTMNDLYPIMITVVKVAVVVVVLGTGNILLGGVAYWWYRQYSARAKAAETTTTTTTTTTTK